MSGCSAVNCSNNRKRGFRMFRFPAEIRRRQVWVQNCRRDKWKPSIHSVLCEAHFEDSQYEKNRQDGWKKLKPNAVPTIFNVPNPPRLLDVRRISLYKRSAPLNNDVARMPASSSSVRTENVRCSDDSDENEQSRQKEECISTPGTSLSTCNDGDEISAPTSHDELVAENKMLKEQLKILQNTLEMVRKTMAVKNEELRKKISEMQQQMNDSNLRYKRFLTEEQMESLGKSKMKEWSAETIIKALKYRFMLGVHGYEFLRKTGYPIPSYSTLNRRLANFKVSTGILHELLEPLRHKVSCMEPADRFCTISIDEMQINSTEDYQPHLKEFVGFVSLGGPGEKELGSHILLVLIRGLRTNWKQIIACEVTSSRTKKEQVAEFLLQCIQYVETCGLRVVAFSSDMGHLNVGVWNVLGVYARKDGATKNSFRHNDHDIFAVPDVCHLAKNLKCAVLSQEIHLSAEIVAAYSLTSSVVSGKYVKMLWEWEVKNNKAVRSLYHLQRQDLYPNNFQKMHVGSAVRFFSLKTAAAISLAADFEILPEEARATSWFIKLVAEWFELMSARAMKKTITRRNKTKKMDFLSRFITIFRQSRIGNSWKPLNTGMVLATLSLCDISEVLFSIENFDFILTHRFNQDAVENCFSQIRRRAGSTPTVSQCLTAIKTITMAQFVSDVKKTNYFNSSDEFLLEYFSREVSRKSAPLPASLFSFPSPDFSAPFETLELLNDGPNSSLLENFDLNVLYFIAGACLNALFKTKLCDSCINVVNSGTEPVDEKLTRFVSKLNKGGLQFPNVDLFNLIINCEKIYNKYFQYILHNNQVNLINKIVNEINISLPQCHICGDLKFFVVNHFFKVRCFAVDRLRMTKKKQQTLYGTATLKKRKIT